MRALVVLNAGGKEIAETGTADIRDRVAAAFAAAGIDAVVKLVRGPELARTIHEALSPATGSGAPPDAVVVGGGDGSIGTAAGHLVDSEIALGVLPLGTLNHFARDLGLPLELDDAVRTIASGHTRYVDVADVNGIIFINNSSIGLYPYMLSSRDRQRRRFALGKWAAMILAFGRAMLRFPVHRLYIRVLNETQPRRTPCVLIANNLYNLDAVSFGARSALNRGELGVYVAASRRRLHFLVLTVKAIAGRLSQKRDLELFRVAQVEIRSHAKRLHVAIDGELKTMRPPLRYRIRPRALRVIVPPPANPTS